MTLRPMIDAACSGHGDCEHIAPDAFRVDDVAVVIGAASDEVILRAALACPAAAISVLDVDTGRVIYP
jgi:ferredoxin